MITADLLRLGLRADASGGLTDKIDNWISPGSSCTIPHDKVDETIGGLATAVASGGGSVEADTAITATRSIDEATTITEETTAAGSNVARAP